MTHSVLPNNAVAFGGIYDQFSRAKSIGATTIIHFKRWSVVVGRAMYSCPARVVIILQHPECIMLDLSQLLLLFLGHVLLQDTEALQQFHVMDTVYQ